MYIYICIRFCNIKRHASILHILHAFMETDSNYEVPTPQVPIARGLVRELFHLSTEQCFPKRRDVQGMSQIDNLMSYNPSF